MPLSEKAMQYTVLLQLIDPKLPSVLQTDASNNGTGVVVLQVHLDAWELAPVMHASHQLKGAERNYSTIKRKALAIF